MTAQLVLVAQHEASGWGCTTFVTLPTFVATGFGAESDGAPERVDNFSPVSIDDIYG